MVLLAVVKFGSDEAVESESQQRQPCGASQLESLERKESWSASRDHTEAGFWLIPFLEAWHGGSPGVRLGAAQRRASGWFPFQQPGIAGVLGFDSCRACSCERSPNSVMITPGKEKVPGQPQQFLLICRVDSTGQLGRVT